MEYNMDKVETNRKLELVLDYLNEAAGILFNIEGTVCDENYQIIEGIIDDLESFKRFL